MRRLLVSAALIGGLAAIGVSHNVMAAPPAKVEVCHVNSSNTAASLEFDWVVDYANPIFTDIERHYTTTYHLGRVIEVNAVAAHVGHGDSTTFFSPIPAFIETIYDRPDINTDLSHLPFYNTYTLSYQYTDGHIGNGDCYWFTFVND